MTVPRLTPCAVVCVLAPVMLAAQSRWERQVRQHLVQTGTTLRTTGYAPAGPNWSGALDNAETAADSVTLEAGTSYVLVGVCDEDCRGLDLGLFAPNGYEVEAARGSGNAPIIRITPRETGRYRVTVRMSACGRNPCWYGVGVFARK